MFPYERLSHLIPRRQALDDVRIMQVGVGSGGMQVLQHLVMAGVKKFTLIDPDTHDASNLVKHPAGRSVLGRPKVQIASDWVLDRNPACEVQTHTSNIFDFSPDQLQAMLDAALLLVCATDGADSREYLNDVCVASGTPFTLAMVHRGGLGGTIMCYRPAEGGCYHCLRRIADGVSLPSDFDQEWSQAERDGVYGGTIRPEGTIGLSADIALVTAIHAHVTLSLALTLSGDGALPPPAPWIALNIRDQSDWNWSTLHLDLPALDGCPCAEVSGGDA
jgi:molybdopterin/thiamine biosynthesis adenylyltransferase